MFVVKGEKATAKTFVFRVDAKQKITVGVEPVEIDIELAQCYLESGHLKRVDPPKKDALKETKPEGPVVNKVQKAVK